MPLSAQVSAIRPSADTGAWLAGAQFCDAFSIIVDDAALDARHAAERMLGQSPRWAKTLLAVRDAIVTPFGLATSKMAQKTSAHRIGMFPVISETPQRLVAGFDDRHLDFRVVIDVASVASGTRATATTLVLTHNLLGRIYLTIILPFHRLIVRAMCGKWRADGGGDRPRQRNETPRGPLIPHDRVSDRPTR